MAQHQQPSDGAGHPADERGVFAMRLALHDALKAHLSAGKILPTKLGWCMAELDSAIRTFTLPQIQSTFSALCSGEGWSATSQERSSLVHSPPHLAELSSAIIRGLTKDSMGEIGFREHVLPEIERGKIPVFISNQRFMTDSAIVSHSIGGIVPDRIVEFSCGDSFPDPFSRAILQGGRSVVRTNDSVLGTIGNPIENIAGSPWEKLFEAMRRGKLPLLFPEALNCQEMRAMGAERTERILRGEGWMLSEAQPFRAGAIAPFMGDIPETLGIDPKRVSFVPTKVLYSGDVWYRYDICEEIDTIVKFGAPIALSDLRRDVGVGEDCSLGSLRSISEHLRERVLGLGVSYLD